MHVIYPLAHDNMAEGERRDLVKYNALRYELNRSRHLPDMGHDDERGL